VHQYYLHIYDGVSGAPLGPPIPCAHNPSYVGFSPDCDLLTNSNSTDAILKWNGSEWIYFVQPGAGGLDFPGKFAFGPDGHLYVCSRYTDEILRYNGETGAPYPEPGAVFASGCGLDFPYDLAFGPSDGNLYVVGPYTDGVLEFDGATGDCIEPPPFADCGPAWTLAFVPDPDTDDDLIPDACDNCPNEYNPGQEDCNDDGEGDICDPDPGEGDGDADGVCDYADVCPCTPGFVEFVDDEGRPKGDLDDDCDVDLNDFATFAGSYGAVACQ
jgi:hypothetical protein